MVIENSMAIIIGFVIATPFIIFFVHRSAAYKRLQKKLNVENKVLSKLTVSLGLIWLVLFSAYLLFIDTLPFEMGKYWMLSYISYPVMIMLFGGSLYRKTLISVGFSLIYGGGTFLIMHLLGKAGYYDKFLRSGEPTAPLITTLFISFAIIVSIAFLITAIANTILTKIRRSK